MIFGDGRAHRLFPETAESTMLRATQRQINGNPRKRPIMAINKPSTGKWMGAALGVALAIVLVIRLGDPLHDQTGMALRATARWSFCWFWLASTGGALAQLFGTKFQALARRARDFGLAFAAAHLVHLGLVANLLYHSTTPFPRFQLVLFSVGVFWVYLLALLSFKPATAVLQPRTVRLIRSVGVEYIAVIFLYDFVNNSRHHGVGNFLFYLPFLAFGAAGPLLRLAAAAKRIGT
jgi:hypothetical protein